MKSQQIQRILLITDIEGNIVYVDGSQAIFQCSHHHLNQKNLLNDLIEEKSKTSLISQLQGQIFSEGVQFRKFRCQIYLMKKGKIKSVDVKCWKSYIKFEEGSLCQRQTGIQKIKDLWSLVENPELEEVIIAEIENADISQKQQKQEKQKPKKQEMEIIFEEE